MLVLAVENAVDYHDLGVATSGATVFRSIGGSVGTAILGSIFSTRLASHLHSAIAAMPPAMAQAAHALGSGGIGAANPAALKKLPPPVHAAYVHAFTTSLGTVFVVAAGVAAVGFVLTWA